MLGTLRGAVLDREGLTVGLAQLDRHELKPLRWCDLSSVSIPPRGGMIGRWHENSGDPLPELLVVRDEDHADTLAWLSSYFAGLSPITQWCRILTVSQVGHISEANPQVTLRSRLGAWVGAILAECSVQSDGAVNLKELPGSAALSTATFAAGRATAVWADGDGLVELGRRHDELSHRLRDGTRPISASALLPLWQLLSRAESRRAAASDRRALDPFDSILERAFSAIVAAETPELIQAVAIEATDHFDLPELLECAKGPQVDRLRALDRLAARLLDGPHSPAVEALLGLAASFVEPGTAVLPDLLRKYTSRFPLAPIWLGAFAGAWAPLRVIAEQQGLGRLIAKSLLAPTDLEARPAADIAYEELARWLAPGRTSQRLDLRGMSARSLSVEILPAVTCAFAHGRGEAVAPTAGATRGEGGRSALHRNDPAPSAHRRSEARTIENLWELVTGLNQRMDRLERNKEADVQPRLDLAEPNEAKPRKGKPSSYGPR